VLDAVDRDTIVRSLLMGSMERVEELRRDIAAIEGRLRSRTVSAPCDGYVSDVFSHGGDVIRAFEPILSVDESVPEYVTVYIPEKADLPLRVGMEVKIYSPKLKRYMNPGTIATIHPGLSRTPDRLSFMRQTFWARRIQVRLGTDHGLLPGEVVYARIDRQPE